MDRDGPRWEWTQALQCTKSCTEGCRQTDGRWHPHQTAHRMLTDSICFLNLYKPNLADNKNASKESCCVYWKRSSDLSLLNWVCKRGNILPQGTSSASSDAFQNFRYLFTLYSISLPTDSAVSWDAEHLSAVRAWQRRDGKWGIIPHPLF